MTPAQTMTNSTPVPTNVSSESIFLPPVGTLRIIITIVFCISFYLPLVILVYYCNRHRSGLRYRNPVDMSFTATSAFMYSFARCMGSLYVDQFSCTFRLLSFGVPLQLALMGYFLAELRVVLTFYLTELMVAHTEKKTKNKKKLVLLHSFLKHGLLSIYRILFHLIWNIPLIVILYIEDYSQYNGTNCPGKLSRQIMILFSTDFILILIGSMYLSFKMSKIVDNFGLRNSFQKSNRIHILLFLFYIPILVFFFDTKIVLIYRLDLFIEIIISHTFIWIHIIIPLYQAFQLSDHSIDGNNFQGTVGILNTYLHTNEGFLAFSTFAKSEFSYECVIAWKTLVDYRIEASDHLSAFEIYEMHIEPNAPLPLQSKIPTSILKRYALAFEANSKYSICPEEMIRDVNYFDVLLDAVIDRILVETLPRFQQHPLGIDWNNFVAKYNTQLTLEKMLKSDINQPSPFLPKKSMPTIKNQILRSTGRLIPIESRRDSAPLSSLPSDIHDEEIPKK